MTAEPGPERRPEPLGFDPRARRQAPPPAAAHPPPPPAPREHAPQSDTGGRLALIGQVLGGRYRVLGVLGEGGMGTVYDAEHLGLGRPVAIKVLSPAQAKKKASVKRFQQEARAAGAIGHPNICEVYDMGTLEDGSPYLVMEKLLGTTLADRISREGGLPIDEIVSVMIEVLSGLIAAHDKGIVHRDIKPENIFLARRIGCPPIAKILDFGVSKMMPQFLQGEEPLDLTRTGMVMGTPYYMSPEQARGERNLDGRVDVYACGVMMYEATVGKRPFIAPNYNALLLAIINSVPRPMREARPQIPRELEAIVAKAMAKARDERYPTALYLLRDLQTLVRTVARPSPGATLKSRMSDGRPNRPDAPYVSSVEIPVHVAEYVDDVPTEVFRPEKHVSPAARRGQGEWDAETVVQPGLVPAAAPSPMPATQRHPFAPPRAPGRAPLPPQAPQAPQNRPAPEPFNPDETLKLDNRRPEDIHFNDETRIAPPRKRR